MSERWTIQLLDGLAVQGPQGSASRFRTYKTGALLAILAYFRRRYSREELAELLWPGHDPDAARNSLSTALWSLRQQLAPATPQSPTLLQADRHSVWLDPALFTTDVREFEGALARSGTASPGDARIEALTHAVAWYSGPLLPGYYEDWVVNEQRRLTHRYVGALRELSRELAATGDLHGAIEYTLRAIDAEPLHEEAHHDLLRLYINDHQPALALQHYRRLATLLKEELGVAPGPALRTLIEGPASSGSIEPIKTTQTAGAALAPGGKPQSLPHGGGSARAALEAGAVPLRSPLYVQRPTDQQFRAAVQAHESVVLIQGPRDTGKSSLLARGLDAARQGGARVILTDLQKLNAEQLTSADAFLRTLAGWIADQADLAHPDQVWSAGHGPNVNFERYFRRVVLADPGTPVVWGLDEADRILHYPFGAEIFRLFRSWHNERALDPTGPWGRLTLAVAYAAEVKLFIPDLDQSPFNVGTRLELEDFTEGQVAYLNQRYNAPLHGKEQIRSFLDLVGGNPYLVRRGLYEMTSCGLSLETLERVAHRVDGPFGDRLAHLSTILSRDVELSQAVCRLLRNHVPPPGEYFYRLRTAGLLAGNEPAEARIRCHVYARYLEQCVG